MTTYEGLSITRIGNGRKGMEKGEGGKILLRYYLYFDVVTDDDDDMFVDVRLHVKSILFSCFKCTMQCYVQQNGWKGYANNVSSSCTTISKCLIHWLICKLIWYIFQIDITSYKTIKINYNYYIVFHAKKHKFIFIWSLKNLFNYLNWLLWV